LEIKFPISRGNYCQVTFDDLTRDSVGEMRRLYEQLSLGDFQPAEAPLQKFADSQRDYKRNEHQITPALRNRIDLECADYIERYVRRSPSKVRQAG